MPIQKIPSFWDYLGRGIENYTDTRERRKEREARERQAKLGELSFLSSLYGQGAVDSGTLQDQINKSGLGLPPVSVMPSTAERRKKILERPDVNIDMPLPITVPGAPNIKAKIPGEMTASDDEREAAGLTPRRQIERENLANRQAKVGLSQTEQKFEGDQRKVKDEQLGDAAGRFVPMVLGKMGRVARSNPEAAAQAAFDEYKRMLASSKFGGLSPADESYARAFFSKAVRDVLMEERKLEIQERIASGRATQQDLRFRQLTTLRESARKELDDMESNSRLGPIISMYKGQPIERVPISFRGLLQAHSERENYIRQIDVKLNELEPTGLTMPQSTAPSSIDTSGDNDPKIQKVAGDLKEGRLTVKQVDEAVAAGVLTKEQANAAKRIAGVVTASVRKPLPKDTSPAWR